MKEVMAIIRMNKVNVTKKALVDMGVCSLTACKVLGRGKIVNVLSALDELGDREEVAAKIAEGLSSGGRLTPRRLLTIVARDEDVQEIVETIIKVNQEGHSGDGKIFVLPILESIRVRTGDRGEAAL